MLRDSQPVSLAQAALLKLDSTSPAKLDRISNQVTFGYEVGIWVSRPPARLVLQDLIMAPSWHGAG